MEGLLAILAKITEVAGFATVAISALLAIALVLPGDEPDKTLQQALDLIKKFSRKKK